MQASQGDYLLLDVFRDSVGMAVGRVRKIVKTFGATQLVALHELVAGLATDAKRAA
jgi:hypothetical protein